jgi:hypothetical protein
VDARETRSVWQVLLVAAAVALGAMTASAAASKLVLKEEGKPVVVGAELGVELHTWNCKVAQRAHLSRNGAKIDRLKLERPGETGFCPDPENPFLDPERIRGGLKEIDMAVAGSAKLAGKPLRSYTTAEPGPNKTSCAYVFGRLSGTFPVRGHAVIEGVMTGTLDRRESYNGSGCEASESRSWTLTLLGANNKALETELIG